MEQIILFQYFTVSVDDPVVRVCDQQGRATRSAKAVYMGL